MMDCHELHTLLRDGRELSKDARQHLDACAACAELVGSDLVATDTEAGPPAELDTLFGSVDAVVAKESGLRDKLLSLSTRLRLTLVVTVSVAVAAVVALGMLRSDFFEYPPPRMVLVLVLFGAVMAWLTTDVVRPLYRARAPRRVAMALPLALMLPWLIALLPAAQTSHPDSLVGVGDAFLSAAMSCLGFGLVMALPLIGILWSVDRTEQRRFRMAAVVAAAGGLFGNLILQLHCPIVHVEHLLAGHATVSLVLVVLYGLVVGALFRRTMT